MASGKQWVGEEELQNLLKELRGHSQGVPTSKIKQIVSFCNKHIQDFKMIVYEIEKYIRKAEHVDKLGGLFVLDSLSRQHSKERDTFMKRFAIRLKETMSFMNKVPAQDKHTMARLVDAWRKNNVFPSDVLISIQTELGLASSGTSNDDTDPNAPSRSSSSSNTNKKRSQPDQPRPATTEQAAKKATKLCPFRDGNNCPFGDKCRFSHHDGTNNTLEQYAARLLPNRDKHGQQLIPVYESSEQDAMLAQVLLGYHQEEAAAWSASIPQALLFDTKILEKLPPAPPLLNNSLLTTINPSSLFSRRRAVFPTEPVLLPPTVPGQPPQLVPPPEAMFEVSRMHFDDMLLPSFEL